MAAPLLVKHTAESRLYTFDFGGGVQSATRGTTWAQTLFGAGEAFGTGLSLPLLLASLSAPPAPPTITVARGDGGTADLSLGTPTVQDSQVRVQVSGGTSGQTYTLTCVMQSNRGGILVIQGRLLVVATLP